MNPDSVNLNNGIQATSGTLQLSQGFGSLANVVREKQIGQFSVAVESVIL